MKYKYKFNPFTDELDKVVDVVGSGIPYYSTVTGVTLYNGDNYIYTSKPGNAVSEVTVFASDGHKVEDADLINVDVPNGFANVNMGLGATITGCTVRFLMESATSTEAHMATITWTPVAVNGDPLNPVTAVSSGNAARITVNVATASELVVEFDNGVDPVVDTSFYGVTVGVHDYLFDGSTWREI